MQYHYVVMYDEDTDDFSIDVGTTEAKFGKVIAFDNETNNWYDMDELMEADYLDYEQMLHEKLSS